MYRRMISAVLIIVFMLLMLPCTTFAAGDGTSFNVTVTGSGASQVLDAAETATNGTDYTFTKPYAPGYGYNVTITIGGITYTGYTVDALGVYTIDGADITGDIAIVVARVMAECTVVVMGASAGIADGYVSSVANGDDYTLAVTPEDGVDYEITATIDTANGKVNAPVIDNGDNTYTVADVTGYLTFTIDKSIEVDDAEVEEYLQLNNNKMWLLKVTQSLPEGKVVTYDGNPMYWVEGYEAYCYLVVSNSLTQAEIDAKIGIADGNAVVITNDGDVNNTDITDANDAQTAYNIYNTLYAGFTDNMSVDKFLSADMNLDGRIGIDDAVAIINSIL